MLLNEAQFERASDLFYEAAAVPELWPKALEAVADACGALGTTLLPVRPGPDAAVSSPAMKGIMDAFVDDGWLKINPYMRRGMELTAAGWCGLITSEDMLTPEESARDLYVNEYRRPSGLGPEAGMLLANAGPDLVLPMTIVRPAGGEPFSRREVAKMNRLVARLKPAANLALKVGFSAAQKVADTLGDIGKDVVLLSGSGRVLHMPPGFDRYIGDALNLRLGFLSSWHGDSDRLLAAAIQRALGAASAMARAAKAVALPRMSGRRPIVAHVVAIVGAAHDVFMLAQAALILTDPDDARTDPTETLSAVLGLTRAEARLASRIGNGEELKDIAEAEGIATETARARLKSIFAKTGTHRQAELAILVVGLLR